MKFDAATLHERPDIAAETGMVDDGNGVMEVFRVDHFELESVPEKDYGKFYSGDCYVVLYAYNDNGKKKYLIYFWLVCMKMTVYTFDVSYRKFFIISGYSFQSG